MENDRKGKITLKKHSVEIAPSPEITSHELINLREKLMLSQAVFAYYLKVSKRTLENWEQGRSKPNAQAAVLIKLVEKYPDTIERISNV